MTLPRTPHDRVLRYLALTAPERGALLFKLHRLSLDGLFTHEELSSHERNYREHSSAPVALTKWLPVSAMGTVPAPSDPDILEWLKGFGVSEFYENLFLKEHGQADPDFMNAWTLFKERPKERQLVEALMLGLPSESVAKQLSSRTDADFLSEGAIRCYARLFFDWSSLSLCDLNEYLARIEKRALEKPLYQQEAQAKRFALANPGCANGVLAIFNHFSMNYDLKDMAKEIQLRAGAQLLSELARPGHPEWDRRVASLTSIIDRLARLNPPEDGPRASLSDFCQLFLKDSRNEELFDRAEEIAKGNYFPRGMPKVARAPDQPRR